MLLLKRHLVELVRQGRKRQTIRLWTGPLLRVGQISYTPGLGRMKITAVDRLASLEALTEADAVADGFVSRAALLAEIRRIYGPSPKGRHIYRIRFEWPIAPGGAKDERRKTKDETKKTTRERPKTKVGEPGPIGERPLAIGHRRSFMSSSQRQTLRRFILACAPRAV